MGKLGIKDSKTITSLKYQHDEISILQRDCKNVQRFQQNIAIMNRTVKINYFKNNKYQKV